MKTEMLRDQLAELTADLDQFEAMIKEGRESKKASPEVIAECEKEAAKVRQAIVYVKAVIRKEA